MFLSVKRRNNNNNNRDEESRINGLYIELRGNITGMYTHQDDRRKAAVSMTTSRRLFCCIAATCIYLFRVSNVVRPDFATSQTSDR